MLWTITGRDAYAELLCAAFCPLMIAAVLATRPSPWRVGLPLALMWLSNVPGGILGTYLLVFLALVRIVLAYVHSQPLSTSQQMHALWALARTYIGGFVYGLALASCFLIPANAERRFIHMEHAFMPNFQPTSNLFFLRTLVPARDEFFIRTQHIALGMAAATLLALIAAWLIGQRYSRTPDASWRDAGVPMAALFITGALAFTVIPATRVSTSGINFPADLQKRMQNHSAPDPTDEYVVATGNADFLRPDNPPFWLASSPTAYAPGTTPNPAATDPANPWPTLAGDAHMAPTALHFTATTDAPAYLVVNLQDYPNWRIARDHGAPLPHLRRPDGLLTVALPTGASDIAIVWHHSWDEYLGYTTTLLALGAFACTRRLRKQ
jgi:hypothetical protein